MIDNMKFETPENIEKKSFEIIDSILKNEVFKEEEESVIKRVIHASADFDYVDNLKFYNSALNSAIDSVKKGNNIVTDTKMVYSGINKKVIFKNKGKVFCYMDDEEIAKKAKRLNKTRAYISMKEAAKNKKNKIFIIGNAPTAIISLYESYLEGILKPDLIIAMPVGFVNIIESKELFMKTKVPLIVSKGRKGGSNVAAAAFNAILYKMDPKRGA